MTYSSMANFQGEGGVDTAPKKEKVQVASISNDYSNYSYTPEEDYVVLDQLLDYKAEGSLSAIQKILDIQKNNNLEIPLDNLIGSYIHMLVNRAFRSKQRFYELICYDFLVRYHKTKVSYVIHK